MLDIDELHPDFIGMIFHSPSLRFIGENTIPKTITSKVGVFVNSTIEYMIVQAKKHDFTHIQLHGSEDVSLAKELYNKGFKIIKTFSIDKAIDNSMMEDFTPYCSYFLFDTKGENPGGNGSKFNWKLLQNYQLETPFLLSGGIEPEDVKFIKNIKHKAFSGVDINSRFETSPGIKNVELIKIFINEIRK